MKPKFESEEQYENWKGWVRGQDVLEQFGERVEKEVKENGQKTN